MAAVQPCLLGPLLCRQLGTHPLRLHPRKGQHLQDFHRDTRWTSVPLRCRRVTAGLRGELLSRPHAVSGRPNSLPPCRGCCSDRASLTSRTSRDLISRSSGVSVVSEGEWFTWAQARRGGRVKDEFARISALQHLSRWHWAGSCPARLTCSAGGWGGGWQRGGAWAGHGGGGHTPHSGEGAGLSCGTDSLQATRAGGLHLSARPSPAAAAAAEHHSGSAVWKRGQETSCRPARLHLAAAAAAVGAPGHRAHLKAREAIVICLGGAVVLRAAAGRRPRQAWHAAAANASDAQACKHDVAAASSA